MKIVWLVSARRDAESIHAWHLREAGADIANRVLRRIVHSAELLDVAPYRGRPSQSTDGIHELVVPSLPYVLPYRVKDGRIEILRIFHISQELPESWT